MNYFKVITTNGGTYELSNPEWLLLIPLLIVITISFRWLKSNHMRKSSPANLSSLLSKQLVTHPLLDIIQTYEHTEEIKLTSKMLYFVINLFIILALTQPIRIGEKLPTPPLERDITFIVDTSVSMILRDYILNDERIDRMSLLKGVLDDFILKLKGQRMSIVVFGDYAYTFVPLTTDQQLLRRMLSRIQATMAGRFNAIGEAIALAVQQAEETNNKNTKAKSRKRILVLLTDADQPTGKIDPLAAAQLAKHANLPLYTIAIGATSPAADESRPGGLIYSPVDLDLVKKLSNITNAKSYQAGSPKALENAIRAISLHETNKREIKTIHYPIPLYHWFLIAAFVVFCINQVIQAFYSTLALSSSRNKQGEK